MKKLILVSLTVLVTLSIHAATVDYVLRMPEPHTHYFEVEMNISGTKGKYTDIKMPVWAPGSYLVREFSRNVEDVVATDANGKSIEVEKQTKNTWRVKNGSNKSFTVNYRVYAFELSVRTSFLDASHGYVNGTSVFMFVDGNLKEPGKLKIEPFKEWEVISTGMPKDGGFGEYKFINYDQLVDCPIEIGNQFVFEFNAAGVKHYVAMYGEGNYDVERLKEDMAKIVEACTNVFGFNPNEEYTFIIHNITDGGGGLEHVNSTTLQVDRWAYEGSSYRGFLSLVAHEYFHLWNVKRIRPIELGPFDYENEVYTSLLWIMEGFTSYYDELLLLRAGFYEPEDYMRKMSSTITYVENQPGNRVLPLSEASMDAWIKLYRPNENSVNTTVSYYSKGSIIAFLLDLEIITSTKGEKRLDDVLVYLYKEYYEGKGRGFTAEEAKSAIETVAGKDMTEFFEKYINGAEPVKYNMITNPAGLTLIDLNEEKPEASLGVRTRSVGGKLTISTVLRNTSAYESGLNVNDEIIAIDGYRVDDGNFSSFVDRYTIGDKAEFLISRDNQLRTIEVTFRRDPSKNLVLTTEKNASEELLDYARLWLGIN